MADHQRAAKLQAGPSPEELIAAVARETAEAATDERSRLTWEHSTEAPDYFRTWGTFRLTPDTFDALFNGPTGYRAQYYLSVMEGMHFNRSLIAAVAPAIQMVHRRTRNATPLSAIEASLSGPMSKAWIADDGIVLNAAPKGELRPKRWLEASDDLGSMPFRAPRPDSPSLDIKGTWFRPSDGAIWVHELKADRDCFLHQRGHA
jgi:hypothetical protein